MDELKLISNLNLHHLLIESDSLNALSGHSMNLHLTAMKMEFGVIKYRHSFVLSLHSLFLIYQELIIILLTL